MANTLRLEQLEAIKRGFNSRVLTRHSLDIKVSVPIPGLRFYRDLNKIGEQKIV
ncbi:hypothetical protein Npun_F1124 [Nostoc punctiforme PCC 73102]|uniref:Uncharacterized protein n=1 Tax=Nostoc punctiforme (strain ATCC 29133 / PCC 73102) TaxID=63737 RepID=B2IWA5_NOSP7|nr:hypothetical protein Npun_F1124 [Nostoc punctiforme PCC 73102]